MTPSELKAKVEETGSHFFNRKTMKFFGDTMRNFAVSGPMEIETHDGKRVAYQLRRRKPVKSGICRSHYFDSETFKEIHQVVKI